MILVDTSAWIEWLKGSPTDETLAGHLPEQADWPVPTIVQLDLAKWLAREVGEDKADQVIAFTQVCQVAPLDTDVALAAAEACRAHKLASADAIVFATARAPCASCVGRHPRRTTANSVAGVWPAKVMPSGTGPRDRSPLAASA